MTAFACLALAGCQSPREHRAEADRAAAEIIEEKQREAVGETEPFSVERPSETFRQRLMIEQELPAAAPPSFGVDALPPPEHWPDTGEPDERPESFIPPVVELSLIDALQVGAANSRSYQDEKESLFRTALQLDLERFRFDTTFRGTLEAIFSTDQATSETGVTTTGELGIQRRFQTGADFAGRLVVDLTRLLRGEGASSLGLLADASITVPLLRGAGRHVVTEPLTQAERDVVYAIYFFERFKANFAAQIADQYFSVLQQLDQIANTEASYRRLLLLVERTEALHERGRVTGIEVDQARQDLLRARERWISARENHARQLDGFKITLGLPTDSHIALTDEELGQLMQQVEEMFGEEMEGVEELDQNARNGLENGDEVVIPEPDPRERGRYELDEDRAIALALEHRLDLRAAEGEVFDAQRRVTVAADALRPGLNLTGSAVVGDRRSTVGAATLPDARLDPSEGFYSAGMEFDMPWSRRAERIDFRQSLIDVDARVRNFQRLEDEIKLDVRNALRDLLEQREGFRIQTQALDVAERRVRQAQAFQEVGRADTRDVLEANEALLEAQNAVVEALISYRISELNLQRDLGLLDVDHRGLWEEFDPEGLNGEENYDDDNE